METPHFKIHSQKHPTSAEIILETLAYHQAIFTTENLFGPFPPPEKERKHLGARSHRHRTSATDSTNLLIGGNINKKTPLHIFFLFLLSVIYFSCFSLVFISVYFFLHHWTATKESRFLSRCSLAQARVKTLATVSSDDWFLDVPDEYETRYLLCYEHTETCSPNGCKACCELLEGYSWVWAQVWGESKY